MYAAKFSLSVADSEVVNPFIGTTLMKADSNAATVTPN